MIEGTVTGLATILFLGISAQLIAWRLGIPSILFLLGFGLLAGPFLGIIQPDQILGDLLFPIVSISVAILIFEGAINLRIDELKKASSAVRNLLSIGTFITFFLCAFAAHFLLAMDFSLSLVLGAILTVTGPTVVAPILRSVRLSPTIGAILRWEGIIVDSIGAILAVLVYETFFGEFTNSLGHIFLALGKIIFVGVFMGSIVAYIILQLIRYEIIPEFLQSPFTLMALIVSFSLSNLLQKEAGILTATVMGLVMANQKIVPIKRITEFKESLQVLLIASLFIVLSARIEISALAQVNLQSILFVLVLLLIIRPLSVIFSTWNTGLKWKEILFLSAIAPRGIVAAAISSLLALELQQSGYPNDNFLVPIVFTVIVLSGLFSTLLAKPLAHFLNLTLHQPRGILLLGAHAWARELASCIKSFQIPVMLIDTNPYNAYRSQMENIPITYANILEKESLLELYLGEMGKFLALTSNDEVNSLAVISFQDILGKTNVYQLPSFHPKDLEAKKISTKKSLHGKQLFSTDLSFSQIANLYAQGWKILTLSIQNETEYKKIKQRLENELYPLVLIQNDKAIPYSTDKKQNLQIGQNLIALAKAN